MYNSMKKIFTKFAVLTFFCLLLINVAFAQNVNVSGNVKDAGGTAMPFVTITIKGTNKGVQTEMNGNYTISAPTNGTLVFSYLGYLSQEIAINNQSKIDVTLNSDTQNLEQVVVVGYGTQKRKDVTGSVSSIKGEEIAKMPAVNPMASLQGKVPGLTVANSGGAGSQPVVRLRGIASTNNANPLYVVDGMIQENIDFLNPADIESIDVSRDASSAAIYGLRGSNGVIAITTKRAARGQTRINFTSNVGVQKVNNKIDVVDADGFKKLYSAQLANLNAAPFDYSNYTGNTNWQDLIMRSAIINNNSLSFSNSNEKTTTLLSLGYNNQEGVLKNDKYQKYVLRLNEEIRVTDKFKVGGDITGFHALSNPTAASITNALWAAPIVKVQEDASTYYAMPSFQRAQVGNPMATINRNEGTSINKAFRFNGSIFHI
jgi:TonB-linked SusC/RagA family outer membrane protein